MKRFVPLLFLVFINGIFSNPANAQVNLVPNPSFEVYDTCPYYYGQIDFALPWFQPYFNNSSTDYFNNCDTGNISSVPYNYFGNQLARTGNGYAGFAPAHLLPSNYREYLEVQLLDTLETGKKYCVSLYVSFAENSEKAIDVIGAYLSNYVVVDPIGWYVLPYIPQVVNSTGNIITDSISWILISGDFIANGGEKYITIGNFNNDANTNFIINNNGTQNFSYYYIDDVSVILCDSTTGLNDLSNHQNTISIFPNPATTNCTITAPNFINSTLIIYDITGRVLLQQGFNAQATINMVGLKAGMYVVEVTDKGGKSVKGKLIVDN